MTLNELDGLSHEDSQREVPKSEQIHESTNTLVRRKTVEEDKHHPNQALPSLTDLKKSIPDHCFQSNLLTSLYYVAKDLTMVFLLWFGLKLFENQIYLPNSNNPLFIGLYCVILLMYWFFQGTMFWAIFVLGHDCGHGSFSRSTLLNDVIGTILHSFILVPYYSWKLTHRKHHKNTGNYDKDEIFMPVKSEYQLAPFLLNSYFLFGTSWFLYLVFGYKMEKPTSHFNPWAPLFQNKRVNIIITILSDFAMICLVVLYGYKFGFLTALFDYLIPVFVFASWLVVVTFLHHHEEEIGWYDNDNWNYVKGNLSSVDRDYGFLHYLTHNIGTHQIHHLFPAIPHYHLEEATLHFRKKYPHLVHISDERILPSFFENFYPFATQTLPNENTPIFFYRNKVTK